MITRYQKKHYEDVARLLVNRRISMDEQLPEYMDGFNDAIWKLVEDFADLFAADNLTVCHICGDSEGTAPPCVYPKLEHVFEGGFNREEFLAACGLEPTCPFCGSPSKDGEVHLDCANDEQAYSDYVAGKMAGDWD